MHRENLTQDLIELLGMDDFIRLVEAYGGLRQFIPHEIEKSEMTTCLGEEIMQILSKHYSGATLRIPIARFYLAKHYRQIGFTDREIATKLRITESTVHRIFKRSYVKRPPKKQKKDPRQFDMF